MADAPPPKRQRLEQQVSVQPVVLPTSAVAPFKKRFGTHKKDVPRKECLSNFFRLEMLGKNSIYFYDVQFQPSVEITRKKYQLINKLKNSLPFHLFTGANVFSVAPLPSEPVEVTWLSKSNEQLSETTYKITFVSKGACDHNKFDARALALFNNVLHTSLRLMSKIAIGAHHFNPTGKKEKNFELLPGFSTSMQLNLEGGSYLLADFKQKILLKQNASEIFDRCRAYGSKISDKVKKEVEQQLIGRSIITQYNKNKITPYKIIGVAWNENCETNMKKYDKSTKSSIELSYFNYYNENYSVKVSNKYPLLIANLKLRNQKKKEIRLMPELCMLTGITDKRELNSIRKSLTKSPSDRVKEIAQFSSEFENNPKVQELMQKWGIGVKKNALEVVKAYAINEEKLYFGNERKESPKDGEWKNAFNKNQVFFKPVALIKWLLVHPRECKRDAEIFSKNVNYVSQGMGITIYPADIVEVTNDDESFVNAIHKYTQKQKYQLIVILLKNQDKYIYRKVKDVLCADIPIPCQCVTSRNVDKLSNVTNVAIQMQCKITGIPWAMSFPFKLGEDNTCMFVGIHETPSQKSEKYFTGALVATTNIDLTATYTKVFYKRDKDEMVSLLKGAINKALGKFKQNTGQYPFCAMIYREGLSEGMIPKLYAENGEITQIAKTLIDSSSPIHTKLVYVSVNKRVQAKFFNRDDNGKISNVPAGTVIDNTVTQNGKPEFYLCSTSTNNNQGTTNPVRYQVLANTFDWDRSIILLTHKLTHYYFNWTGVIRVPAPLMYATKATSFIAEHLQNDEVSTQLEDKLYFL